MQTAQKRQCWECRRRRLVCDASRPACNKCLASGTECPGYDGKKPLKWLAPGKVKSRDRKRTAVAKDRATVALSLSSNRSSSSSSGSSVTLRSESPEELTETVRDVSKFRPSESFEFPIPIMELASETCDFVQAVCYYNSCVYPDYAAIHELAPNPYLLQFPMVALHVLPMSICHTTAYLALSHRVHQLAARPNGPDMTEDLSRLYHHRGAAMRGLSEDIANTKTRCSDDTLLSVLIFLFADIRQFASSQWRYHFTGATQLILLRGGLQKLVRSSEAVRPSLLYFMLIGVIGNTTSPASDQIPATSDAALVDIMAETYGDGLFPALLCPPSLLLEIIRINHVRLQATKTPRDESLEKTAYEILDRIQTFSPEQWSVSNASQRGEFQLLGRLYQSAVAVYCVLSLQSVSVLPSSPQNNATRAAHGSRLFVLLRRALVSAPINKFMMWPLVVAGVEAVNGSEAAKTYVEEQMTKMSGDLGTPVPLTARDVFKRFWASGKTSWDECFVQPYALVT